MNTTVGFWIAVVVLAASVALAAVLTKNKNGSSRFLTPLNVLFAGVLLAGVVLFTPAYFNQESEGPFQLLKALLLSTYSAIRLFAAEGDYAVILDSLGDEGMMPWYLLLSAALIVLAPALTFGIVLSFFHNLSANLQYMLAYFKDTYIFSELNERSLALATDIKKSAPDVAVVFTDVPNPGEDSPGELHERARNLGTICFDKDILVVRFSFHAKDRGLWFFAIGENEDDNVSHGLGLIQRYGSRENSHLYVFSTGAESEALLSGAQERVMRVRRVNEVRSLINRILYDEGHLLFAGALPEVGGEKLITAVVVGMGKHGSTMVRSLSWFCQMDGYRVNIHAFDQDDLAEEKFAALCPELMSEEHNGVYNLGDAHYWINIASGVNVETKRFADQIRSLRSANYVLVALGDDAQNIKTAMHLRMLFEQCGAKPRIQAIVYSSEKREALKDLRNFKGQTYDIDFIGDLESSCSAKVILDSELEAEALRRHMRWGKESEFWGFEYNYRSSVALAIHSKAKIGLGIPGAVKPDAELTEAERLSLEDLEHRRWNAYMRSEGYVFSGSSDKRSRNDLGKMHHDMIPYASLTEEEKRKDSRVASK